MNYSLHPDSEVDLRAAAKHYQERAGNGVAQALLAEFERSVDLLLRHPRIGRFWLNGRRLLLFRHFPFSIIYSVRENEIRILAGSHQRRRPGYWRKRR